MIKRLIHTSLACAVVSVPSLGQADPLSPIAHSTPLSAVPDSAEREIITVTGRSSSPASPDVFGTVALDAGVTVYGARWRRVSAADLKDPRLADIAAAAAGHDPVAKLTLVQTAVRRRINWRRDLDSYRVSDYWAQAGETLNRGHGDGEDIAILKMQILKRAGFAARDLYLSVGRDSARGADTLLLVRVGDRFYALDDRSDRPLTETEYGQFVPVITLGKDSAWLHGTRYMGARRKNPSAVASRQTSVR